ncbi:uncharacterized protein LOC106777304 isoform X2 [Vigna radiata var. radiata]|uniref:Uncharacterized protein LOC106777304 isoform X2 n=1 Tax=Vigna radiata var. radiata TaxID=3916 RepID=A0A3Q0EKN6_VIGRR|nr:uncharacterized protein LOC106777304 isoform X2 [Vigna radiata var. radiata]
MESIGVVSRGIVREVLTRYNYQEWKTLMENYLRGENLWEVVESDSVFDAQRNAKALHIIQLSCAPNIFDQIKHFQTSHIAWNHLANVCRSEFKVHQHILHDVVSDFSEHKALYKFVQTGDWEGTSSYLRGEPNAIIWVPPSEMQDKDGNTALALAAGYTGNINIATFFINAEGGKELLAIENKEGEIPLLMAANSGRKRMTRLLFLRTSSDVIDQQSLHNRVLLLERCIQAHIFDVALKLLKSYDELPIESLPVLQELARIPSAYLQASLWQTMVDSLKNGTLIDVIGAIMHIFIIFLTIFRYPKIWEKILRESVFRHKNEFLQILRYYKDIISKFNSSQLRDASVYDAMLEAAKHGNVEFINAMREANHDLLWAMDDHGRDIFSYAVIHRKHNVFQLMHTLCGNKINYRTDMFGDNLLHLAARLGPLCDLNLRLGAALQMQREIQWFKGVKEVVHVKCREAKNGEGKTPEEIFIETHKELMKDGEKWAKETAGTFAIVGVLVITVMFAAIFTVPGGLRQDNGMPILIKDKWFTVFIVADVISLLCSILTVLIYIYLQKSCYAPTDFLNRIPDMIKQGLWCLSLSLVSMMIAFCAALGIVLQKSSLYKHFYLGILVYGGYLIISFIPLDFIFGLVNPIIPRDFLQNLPH